MNMMQTGLSCCFHLVGNSCISIFTAVLQLVPFPLMKLLASSQQYVCTDGVIENDFSV